jgi:16S rRNA (cytidine1402-2'-O)-methyltransferase
MLTFVPTPIGNPQDITIRSIRAFEECDLFLCEDTRNTKHLMTLLHERFDMKMPQATYLSFNEHNGAERLLEVSEDIASKNVLYVSDAGMPVISDPGQILVEYCQKNEIKYDVLPGANAALTAFVASGFNSSEFLFFGFLAHKGKERSEGLSKVLGSIYPVILYESPHRLEKLLSELCEFAPNREIFLAKELTKKYQRYYKGTPLEIVLKLKDSQIRGEWVVVIGANGDDMASLSLHDVINFDLPPKSKAKLVAKLTGKSIKECYDELLDKP